jgi:hypothetical protein
MATGDVNIVIEAQDNASFKLEQVAKETENTVKQIKSVGETTKKSTEVVGVLANTLGQTGLGSYAGQFAALTEKISAFSEVMKTGGTGALAFKAGLAGLVGVIAFQIGNALGNVIFQTEEWTEELEKANAAAKELSSINLSSLSLQFSGERTDIELIRDPAAKQAAYESLFETLSTNVAETENQVKRQAAIVDEWSAAWFKFGERAASAEQSEAALEADRERLKLLTEQKNEIERLLTVEKDREAIRKANADNERAASFIDGLKSEIELLRAKKSELNEIAAANNTANLSQAGLAQQLLDERDLLKAKQAQAAEVEKTTLALERQLAVQRAGVDALQNNQGGDASKLGEDAIKRQEQLLLATNDAERERIRILQEQIAIQEKQNATVMELQKTEAELAKARQDEEARKEAEAAAMRQAMANVQPGVQATESRLLTRGPAERGIDKIAKNTEKTVEAINNLETKVANLKLTLENPVVMEFAT